MRRILVAGNWKMNLLSSAGVGLGQALAAKYSAAAVEILVCPAFPYLTAVGSAIRGSVVQLGGQNLSAEVQGAVTGEVCGDMLKDVGCGWVLIGHSERRQIFGESDELIAKKVAAGLKYGLQVVLCVGELLAERQSGQMEAVLARQMSGLANVTSDQMAQVVIAYEPVWAIGTGVTASTVTGEVSFAGSRGRVAPPGHVTSMGS